MGRHGRGYEHHAEVISNARGLIDVYEIRDRLTNILDLELIADGENSGVELKPDDVRPETLAEEIMVLRNPVPISGQVIPGAEDDGTASRVRRDDLEPRVSDAVVGSYRCPTISVLHQAPSPPSNASASKPIVTVYGHQSKHSANPVGAPHARARKFSAKSADSPLAPKSGSDART